MMEQTVEKRQFSKFVVSSPALYIVVHYNVNAEDDIFY